MFRIKTKISQDSNLFKRTVFGVHPIRCECDAILKTQQHYSTVLTDERITHIATNRITKTAQNTKKNIKKNKEPTTNYQSTRILVKIYKHEERNPKRYNTTTHAYT